MASGSNGSQSEVYSQRLDQAKSAPAKALIKLRPRFVIAAVDLLAGGASDGRVTLSMLGHYLKRTDPPLRLAPMVTRDY